MSTALAQGVRLGAAPRFHLRTPPAERIQLNGGVESVGGQLVARLDWRPPSEDEIALLVAPPATDAVAPGDGALFCIPKPLRARWWEAAEQIENQGEGQGAYARFVEGMVEFLRFKQMPLPESCAFDVRVSQPGQRSTRVETGAAAAGGLGFGAPGRSVVAWINLGDEDTHLLLLNLQPAQMRRGGGDRRAGDELLARFLAEHPGYPIVRVRLEPGDGLWFPSGGIAHDGDSQGKLDFDVVLTLAARGA